MTDVRTVTPAEAVKCALTDAVENPDLSVRCDDAGDVVGSAGVLAEVAVFGLRGRLLPEPVETSTEWGVWWHADDPDGIVMSVEHHVRRDRAERSARQKLGQYGITGYTIVNCEHRRFADGSTWISDWERVETVMPS